jgi:hypothetical protein
MSINFVRLKNVWLINTLSNPGMTDIHDMLITHGATTLRITTQSKITMSITTKKFDTQHIDTHMVSKVALNKVGHLACVQ